MARTDRGDRSRSGPPARGRTGGGRRPDRAVEQPSVEHGSGAPAADLATGERLQKVMAAAGLGSRRSCEVMIDEGRVTVNGEIVLEQGRRVDPDRDVIRVDGSRLPPPRRHLYVALNKPRGVVSTMDD